ncbi:MAG TPA: Hpt domain-containing protein [Chitinophagaceae bacterium]|nr:Hpt domain-containing protein [Chitinophagaceae bacterium]
MNEAEYTDKLIDLNYLRELSLNDTAFEQAIIRQFIVQVPEELEWLKKAIDKKDLKKIKSLAHEMKSSISYLGLTPKLYSYLSRMEIEAATNVETTHFQEDFDYVKKISDRAVQEAKQLLDVPV